MFGVGPQELLIILLIVLLLFGGRKIPEIARGLGRGVREFRKARDGDDEEPEASEGRSARRIKEKTAADGARASAVSTKEGKE